MSDIEEDSPPRRKLYDDEEDDEESEESEDQEQPSTSSSHPKKKRPKRHKRDALSRFLDIEAEVSSEEEEDESDFEEGGDGFITKENDEDEHPDNFSDEGRGHHARVDKRRQAEEGGEKSAEEIARELADRYGRGSGVGRRFTGEMSEIPQRLLMPSVHDGSLWQIRVKPGREREIVFSLMRKSLDLEYTAKPLSIQSAFQRDSLPGMIYVEARSSQQVTQACAGLVGVYPSRGIHLVPIDEMALLLQIKKVDAGDKVVPGTWVRLKRGKYSGDLAQVVDVTENGDEVGVRFVPRVDLNPREDDGGGGNRKRKKALSTTTSTSTARPPQRLFNYEEVIKVYGRNTVSKRGQVFVFLGDTYKDGFIEKDVKLNSIIFDDVNPTLDEITMFSRNPDSLQDNMVDLSIIAEASRKAALAVLQPGDHIEVFQGEQSGVHGIVQEIHGDTLTISAVGLDQKIDLPARSVRKRFKPGDHVKVMQGKNTGETGLVVSVSESSSNETVVTFISDMSMQEVSVFSKDLREAAEVGNTTNIVGEYELHDLVQLDLQTVGVIYKTERDSFRVLDQHSQSRLVRPHQISMRKDKKDSLRAIATDRDSHEIRVGDMMKEFDGEQRKGRVLHIHQSHFAFLHNRDIAENGGVFVTRARSLVSITPKGAMKLAPGADLTKMNPAAAGGAQGGGALVGSAIGRGPRDRLIGAHVVVIKGPHKGYVGIVKDTNGVGLTGIARVELNTGNKIISIEKGKLHRKLPNGTTEPVEGPGANWRRNNNSMGPPENHSSSWSGSRTPGWSPGGRTPFNAGGRTPFNAGGRTPNPYASSGGQTPAWNVGSKTPNPYASGGQTPAWNVGSKTPNPYANTGGGGQTPAWNVGGRTPNPYANNNNNTNPTTNAWGGATPGRNAWGGSGSRAEDTSTGWSSPNPNSGPGLGGWGNPDPSNAPTPGFAGAPTPTSASTPAIPSTPGSGLPSSYHAPTPAFPVPPSSSSYSFYAAPTPGLIPSRRHPSGSLGSGLNLGLGGYEDDLDRGSEFQPPQDWLIDPLILPYITSLKVRIFGTKYDDYLDGKHENLFARVLASSKAADNFEQTALIKLEEESESNSDSNEETSGRSFPTKYIFPVTPSSQDETALVLNGPRKGEKVKMRQRPDSGSQTEVVVVESVPDGSSSGGAFWECQKDWMCVFW